MKQISNILLKQMGMCVRYLSVLYVYTIKLIKLC